ncbi:MAG: response regulator [Gammaproteobacteria bacterium]
MANNYILIVEDNPDDLEMTRRALKKANVGHPVVAVHDGAQALDFLLERGDYENREPHGNPTVVLLDLKLPKVDGLEVLKTIRATPQLHLIPVVTLTSSDEEKDMIRSYDLGANSYVKKPVTFQEFAESVGTLGLYWSLVNRPPPDI